MPDLLVDSPEEGVARITFNRPETLNAFTNATLEEFFQVLDRLRTDFSQRVVVLTGAGRAFSSGHDVADHSTPSWLTDDLGTIPSNLVQQRWWAQVVPALRSLPQPVVAAVNGPVAGGGYALALGADLRLAGRSARFVNAFHTLGAWLTKSALWAGIDGQSLEAAIELEARGQILALATGDAAEHRRAQAEGRAPQFRWH